MEEAKKGVEDRGGCASVITADVRDLSQVKVLVDAAMEATGRLDIMINNAGLEYPGKLLDGDPEQWREVFETNVLAVAGRCRAAVKAMRGCSAEGRIVNVSSVASQRSDSGCYGATKHAVNFARNFAPEFKADILQMAGSDAEVKEGERLPDEVLRHVADTLGERFTTPGT